MVRLVDVGVMVAERERVPGRQATSFREWREKGVAIRAIQFFARFCVPVRLWYGRSLTSKEMRQYILRTSPLFPLHLGGVRVARMGGLDGAIKEPGTHTWCT